MDLTNALLGPLGLVAGSLLALGAYYSGRVVSRTAVIDAKKAADDYSATLIKLYEKQIEDIKQDRDYWRGMALTGTGIARKALDVKQHEINQLAATSASA